MSSLIQRVFSFSQVSQQAYKYGIFFVCTGVLITHPNFAQIRYFGIGLVIFGSFLVLLAVYRWMFGPFISETNGTIEGEMNSVHVNDIQQLHVIAFPLNDADTINSSSYNFNKPPDYCKVVDKPPSYEEAMAMMPFQGPSCDISNIASSSNENLVVENSLNSSTIVNNISNNDVQYLNEVPEPNTDSLNEVPESNIHSINEIEETNTESFPEVLYEIQRSSTLTGEPVDELQRSNLSTISNEPTEDIQSSNQSTPTFEDAEEIYRPNSLQKM